MVNRSSASFSVLYTKTSNPHHNIFGHRIAPFISQTLSLCLFYFFKHFLQNFLFLGLSGQSLCFNFFYSINQMSGLQQQTPPPIKQPFGHQLLVPFSAPVTLPSTDCREQFIKSEQIDAYRENSKTLDWKKEIKNFFKALTKNGCFNYCDGKQPWLICALKMLDFGSRPKMSQNRKEPLKKVKRQRKQGLNSNIICLVNKPPRNQNILVLLLSYRYANPNQKQIYFDVELLSKSSSIIYKKINLRKWQEVHAQIKQAKSRTSHLVLKLLGKEALTNHLYKNKQFLNLLQPFQEVGGSLSFKKEEDSIRQEYKQLQDNQQALLINQVIDRFQFIRDAILQHCEKDSYAYLNINQAIAITIVHSIINLLPVSHHRHLAHQMRPYFVAVMRNLNREHEKQRRRINSVTLNQDHFPVHLENAQNCWRCKKKRGYVCCSTCSRNQGKNISLCLNCYASHHSELNNSVLCHSEQEANAIFEQWCDINGEVQTMMAQIKMTNSLKIEDFA